MRFIDREQKIRKQILQRENSWPREKVETESRGNMPVNPECRFTVLSDDSKVVLVESYSNQCFVAAICDTAQEAQILCAALNWLLQGKENSATITTQAERSDEA